MTYHQPITLQEAVDPGRHCQNHEDKEGAETQSTDDRGPQPACSKVTSSLTYQLLSNNFLTFSSGSGPRFP